MSEETIKELFGKNLNFFLGLNNKTQKDLVDYMGVASSTVLPRKFSIFSSIVRFILTLANTSFLGFEVLLKI